MQINDLKPKLKKKKEKRIGRGGKRGTYSGKGIKGQKARAGASTPSYEKETISKFPKLKGLKNTSRKIKPTVINVSDLENNFDSGVVTTKDLIQKKLIKKDSKAKILGNGEVKKKFEIKGIIVSKSAKEKIEKSGGKVESFL